MPDRPNVLFIMADQHRGDCIGADPNRLLAGDGSPAVHTPNLNQLAGNGVLFSRAYTPIPSCVPARRCLWTGQTPATNGCPNWTTEPWDLTNPLPRLMARDGYQTWLVGKSHSQPLRHHFGFEGMDLHAAGDGDYASWLEQHSDGEYDEIAHGLGRNSWDPRPNHLDEHEHPTHWTTNQALEFLERCDPTRPFFLTVSYHRPHQPFDALATYWDMYRDRELPAPEVGEWVSSYYEGKTPTHPPTDSWIADLPEWIEQRARTGYFGNITHIDQQLNRIFDRLSSMNELSNTTIIYTADHGEMLGDHTLWRKTYAYEGSARIPLIWRPAASSDVDRGQVIDRPVGLEDVMPTILETIGHAIPESVEAQSLHTLGGDPTSSDWRAFYHGEHGPIYDDDNACQWLVDEEMKYIWNPITGQELLFDLETDPRELRNLATDTGQEAALETWRERLRTELSDREEGFVTGGELSSVEAY